MTVLFVNDERTTALPENWAAVVAHGQEAYEWRVLDVARNEVGTLSGATGGRLDFNVDADTRGSGTVRWAGKASEQPDWINIQIQPWYSLTSPDGTVISWPLGVFVPSTPRTRYNDGDWVELDVAFYDRTILLRQRAFTWDPYTTNTVDGLDVFVREILGFADLDGVIEEGAPAARTPLVFLPGATFMQAVNGILDAAGYFGIYADGDGIMRSGPYQRPSSRPVVWDFEDTPSRPSYDPRFTVERDWFTIPNRIVAISQATGDEDPLVTTAYNLGDRDNPGVDPLSYYGRGERWVDEVVDNVDVPDQAALNDYADRILAERMSRGQTVSLQHLPLPLSVNDRVSFRRDAAGVSIPGVVRTMSVECTPGALWSTELREVQA